MTRMRARGRQGDEGDGEDGGDGRVGDDADDTDDNTDNTDNGTDNNADNNADNDGCAGDDVDNDRQRRGERRTRRGRRTTTRTTTTPTPSVVSPPPPPTFSYLMPGMRTTTARIPLALQHLYHHGQMTRTGTTRIQVGPRTNTHEEGGDGEDDKCEGAKEHDHTTPSAPQQSARGSYSTTRPLPARPTRSSPQGSALTPTPTWDAYHDWYASHPHRGRVP